MCERLKQKVTKHAAAKQTKRKINRRIYPAAAFSSSAAAAAAAAAVGAVVAAERPSYRSHFSALGRSSIKATIAGCANPYISGPLTCVSLRFAPLRILFARVTISCQALLLASRTMGSSGWSSAVMRKRGFEPPSMISLTCSDVHTRQTCVFDQPKAMKPQAMHMKGTEAAQPNVHSGLSVPRLRTS